MARFSDVLDKSGSDPQAQAALDALRDESKQGPAPTSLLAVLEHVWERVREKSRQTSLVIGACISGALLVSVGLGFILVRLSSPSSSSPSTPAPSGDTTTIPMVTSSVAVAQVVVHAAGSVRIPGVYRLPKGSRVVDLLEAAGGPDTSLDIARINLASPLSDGQRIYFPQVGESVPTAQGGGAESAGGNGASGPVNLNHASSAELEALPGIGPATAAAIIAHRERVGPFRSVDDLLSVKGLGPAKVAALRDLVVAG